MGKKGDWSSFLNECLENIQNEDYGYDIFEKGQILRPFSGLVPLKTENVFKNLMVAYVHIEYSTYQFSKESKGGWNTPPPGPCGTEKSVVLSGLIWKASPQSVQCTRTS